MQPRILLDQKALSLTLNRLCFELIENYESFENTVLISLQPKGKYLGNRLSGLLKSKHNINLKHGILDITFFRDDFRRSEKTLSANQTNIDFLIEGKRVILIDDVLFSGRSIRAGLDALLAYGRPEKVELCVLIDRRYRRHLPIAPNYVGKTVDTLDDQRVSVEWKEIEGEDQVLLFTK
jgi:pyrimidine operon attenuation protein/uracil phosphoribosyltransferase